MTAKKNVIFDLGMVLIDWDPTLTFADVFTTRDAAQDWLDKIGFHDWNRLQDGGRSFRAGLAAAQADHGVLADPLKDYLAGFPISIEKPVPGSWEILESLVARDVPLFAITNWSADTWPAALELYPRLAQVFRDIVVSGQVGFLKPQPQIYRLLMDRNALEPGACIFIDDNADNVAGAKALGMDAVQFTGADQLAQDLAERGLFA